MFAGAYRGPTHDQKSKMTDGFAFSASAPSPAEARTNAELEYETVAAILSYRHFLKVAQLSYEQVYRLSELASKDPRLLERASSAYSSAVDNLDAQDVHLANLVKQLGYVPKVDRTLVQ